jgi:hypothetical protein
MGICGLQKKKENFYNRNLQTGIKFTALIRSNDFVNIFPTSFYNDGSFEKSYVFMRINTSYVLVTEPADGR